MDAIKKLLTAVVGRLFGVSDVEVEVTLAPEGTGADYASNVALKLAGRLHRAPMEVAEEIADSVRGGDGDLQGRGCEVGDVDCDAVDEFEVVVAKPGFVNFISRDEYLKAKLAEFERDFPKNISQGEYDGKVVVTEFSDPNPFKVLHVGHLYTSIMGEAISRLIENAGGEVHRVNFGGDVGLHVAKTLWALRSECLAGEGDVGARGRGASRFGCIMKLRDGLTIEKIAAAYVEGTRAYEENERAKAEIVALNKMIYRIAERMNDPRLQEQDDVSADEAALAGIYIRGRELSYEYFDEFYAKIGVKFEKYYPESTVAGLGLKKVRQETGPVYKKSDGAVVFRGEKYGLHTRVFINKEGLPTYEAKDVGLIFRKFNDYHFDESVVITGNDIIEYMKVVLKSVSMYAPELPERTRHITHGNVRLPGNEKMSSRKGNFLKAVDVIEMVREELRALRSGGEAQKVDESDGADGRFDGVGDRSDGVDEGDELGDVGGVGERNGSLGKERGKGDGEVDERIVMAALKYAFLKYRIGGDIIFDPKESVSMTGNSGPYILYSVVRAKKVLAKCGDVEANAGFGTEAFGLAERALVKKIIRYPQVVAEATREKAPHILCNYLFEMAQEFSRFYEKVPVAGSEYEAERARLVRVFVQVMEHGLGTLGIEVPEEM